METFFYQPSGKVSAKFWVYFGVFMLLSIPVLGAIYIYLIYYIPIVILSLFITGACGVALGYVAGYAGKLGKLRNPMVLYICTFMAMVLLKYVQWVIYIPLIFSDAYGAWSLSFTERFVESWYLFFDPTLVFAAARFINEVGVWSVVDGVATSGIPLLVVWIGEFLIMAALALVFAGLMINMPFSEKAGAWYVKKPQVIEFDLPQDLAALVAAIKNGDFNQLLESIQSRTNTAEFLYLDVFQPPDNDFAEPYFMTLRHFIVTQSKGKKKKYQAKENVLIELISVDGQTIQKLKEAILLATSH